MEELRVILIFTAGVLIFVALLIFSFPKPEWFPKRAIKLYARRIGRPSYDQNAQNFMLRWLVGLAGHPKEAIRSRAESALVEVLKDGTQAKTAMAYLISRQASRDLRHRSDRVVNAFIGMLDGFRADDFVGRGRMMTALIVYRDPRAVESVRVALKAEASRYAGVPEWDTTRAPVLRTLAKIGDQWATDQLRALEERAGAEAAAQAATGAAAKAAAEAAAQAAAEAEARQMVEAHAHASVDFDADGRVANVNLPAGNWMLEERRGTRYYTQRTLSLLHATELLKAVSSVPQQTYYTVETPDGALSRDIFGFYTEGPIKTSGLALVTPQPSSGIVESVSLTAYGDAMNSQIGVAQLKQQGQYANFVLLMECGHCGYKSPIETVAGPMQRQCYCCGATNNSSRGTITMNLGPNSVEI